MGEKNRAKEMEVDRGDGDRGRKGVRGDRGGLGSE
jgi:hypothetical protein